MRKVKRSELRDFDVYGGSDRTEFIFMRVETARLFHEHPPEGIKVKWTDYGFKDDVVSYEESQTRVNGAPLNYCVSIYSSTPTFFTFGPTSIDARANDERTIFEGDEIGSKEALVREAVRKALPSAETRVDSNHMKWLKGRQDLEERRVKEMLERRNKAAVQVSAFTRKDNEAISRRTKAVVELGNRLFTVSPKCNEFKEALGTLVKFGIPEAQKKDLLSRIDEAEKNLVTLRKAIERMR